MNDKLLTGNRKALFLLIAQNPEITKAELCAMSCASGGDLNRIDHHLMGLASEGLIVTTFRGKRGRGTYRIAKGKGERMLRYLQKQKSKKESNANPAPNCHGFPKRNFQCGQVLQWKELDSPDWGTVVGYFYSYARHRRSWQWCYLIWLDTLSPSAAWCQCDAAWEEDLEVK